VYKEIGEMVRILSAVLMAAVVGLSGCASKVDYGDATARETVTTDFGSTDLQMIAAKMVDDMLVFPPIVQMTTNRRPVAFVDTIKNKTVEHIDTESVTDTIQSKLLNSGKFRFVDMTVVERVRQQLDYQSDSGLVDPNTAVAMGRQIGAEFMLYGNLSSIVKKAGNTKDVYYKFTLKLLNLQTGIIEWSNEKEIRKTRSKSLFGL
jgi:penicillin-binding protein activator